MAKGYGDVIYSLLNADATVLGIVGNKIFPYLAQDKITEPYIVYEKTGLDPTDDKDGASNLDVISFDIEIYTDTLSDNEALSVAVRDVLDRYSGTVQTIKVQSIQYIGEEGGYAPKDNVFINIQSYKLRQDKS